MFDEFFLKEDKEDKESSKLQEENSFSITPENVLRIVRIGVPQIMGINIFTEYPLMSPPKEYETEDFIIR